MSKNSNLGMRIARLEEDRRTAAEAISRCGKDYRFHGSRSGLLEQVRSTDTQWADLVLFGVVQQPVCLCFHGRRPYVVSLSMNVIPLMHLASPLHLKNALTKHAQEIISD